MEQDKACDSRACFLLVVVVLLFDVLDLVGYHPHLILLKYGGQPDFTEYLHLVYQYQVRFS